MSDTPATPRRSREATRQAWAERLARYESSGLPVLDFCRAEGIPSQSFYYWKNKLSRSADTAPPSAVPEFFPIRLAPAAPVEIVLPFGAVLRLSPGCDLAFVRSLIQALAPGAPC